MRKVIIVTFSICLLVSVFLWSKCIFEYEFGKMGDFTKIEYSYIMQNGIKCGNFYISNGNLSYFKFGEAIEINTGFDILSFVEFYDLKIINVDKLNDREIYLLYSEVLPLYKITNNKKFNLQVCIANENVKIGYPAIFDSF